MKHIKKILKTEGIIKAHPNDTLSSVLSKLTSSHDAAFIFDDKNVFQGVINPYYTLIKSSSYDGSTKVEHALFHPPHVKEEDTIGRIVQLMNESKIHYLPVFNNKDIFLGITSARRILKYMQNMDLSKATIGSIAHTQKGLVITVLPLDPVSKAQKLFKDYKTSKIVMVDKNNKLKGIVSHYDLIPYLMAPANKPHRGDRGEKSKASFRETPVKNYAKTTVLTMSENQMISEAIEKILTLEIGSIILIDTEDHPIGTVTTRDILDLLRPDKRKKKVVVSTKHLSKKYQVTFDGFVRYVTQNLQTSVVANEINLIFNEEKNGSLFEVRVHIIMEKGDPVVIVKSGKDISKLLQDVKDIVRREL